MRENLTRGSISNSEFLKSPLLYPLYLDVVNVNAFKAIVIHGVRRDSDKNFTRIIYIVGVAGGTCRVVVLVSRFLRLRRKFRQDSTNLCIRESRNERRRIF